MMRVTLIAGTYQPTHCGVAHYTARLHANLEQLGVPSTVLTTHTAAILDPPDVVGAVNNWQLAELWSLVRSLRAIPTDILHIRRFLALPLRHFLTLDKALLANILYGDCQQFLITIFCTVPLITRTRHE